MTTTDSWAHPVDLLVREIARTKADPGGDDVINLTAAIVNVAREQGTALGEVPAEELGNLWTLAICHRLAHSLKIAFTSRDPSGETWRSFVRAWERAHLEPTGYFEHHRRAFGPPVAS
jgi:hypothetical protein